jgi:hypothetical protein
MNTFEFRQECAQLLLQAESKAHSLRAFVGLDGFVDEIVHAVDKRQSAESFTRLPTIESFSERIAHAAGKRTNIELVPRQTKLGGNGPIMANALASLGLQVTYVGALGYPNLHPVFNDFAGRAKVCSIAEPGRTDAIEFNDGKLMFGKTTSLAEITWDRIQERCGREAFVRSFSEADLVGFVNWTMIPYMTQIWEELLRNVCPGMPQSRRTIFFDLADPEKRPADDIGRALKRISEFEQHFKVILGLNEKEAGEVADTLGISSKDRSPEGLAAMAVAMQAKLRLSSLVIHPVTYALAEHNGKVDIVEGPVIASPVITTGAGDHFNSGFCLGKLLGLSNAHSILCGVATSGFYVKSGQSPSIRNLAEMLGDWPNR